MRIELVAAGPDLSYDELTKLAERARNARPAMQTIMGQLLTAEGQQFESSGQRGGKPWPRDKPSTISRKRRDGHDVRTERRTLALERSLTDAKDRNAIRRTSKQALTLGTKLYYARFQRRRPLLRFTDHDIDKAELALIAWLMEGETS